MIIMCYICPSIYTIIINGYSHYAARVYLAAAFRAIIRHHTSTFYPAQETKFMEDVLAVHPSYESIFKHIFIADTTLLARRVNHPTPTHDTGMLKVHCSKLANVVIHYPRCKFQIYTLTSNTYMITINSTILANLTVDRSVNHFGVL